uniref:Uncharacterized protein LOC106523338 isoform X2 n=1 Tax=Austrofundulus limnaeus TaxID=52670 RepID=A0A2I4BWR2_AUSLI
MNEEPYLTDNINRLLFQLALETRELSQKKNDINQQIKGCRDDIAENKSSIGAIQENLKKLEEQAGVAQSTVKKNKENAKTMKVTNKLLFQYEQTLKTELESRKANYNNDLEVFEERISSNRKTLQSHKDYYHQNPLAQKLLARQSEKEKIEDRIKAWDDQIMTKQKELEHLTDSTVSSFSTEELPDSAFGEQPTMEQGEELEHQANKDSVSSIIDISSIRLDQTANEDETSGNTTAEEIHEQNNAQDPPACFASPEKANEKIWSYHQEQQLSGSGADDVPEDEMGAEDESRGPTEEKASAEEDRQETFQDVTPQPFLEKTTVLSTPAFQFNFSPSSSPHQGTSDTKSPAFMFSLNSNVSSSSFSGFGFDMGSSQEEDSSFTFTDSIFSEKKAVEAKPSSGPEFLFNEPEQSEGFQFAFNTTNPQSASKQNEDEFPFSFNF